MPTHVLEQPALSQSDPPRKAPSNLDLSVQQIIQQARQAPVSSKSPWGLSVASAVLLWASFTPLDWGALGWVALVPLMLLVRSDRRIRGMYLAAYAGGFLFFLPTLQWMRLGDPTMYLAWGALTLYLAFYFPLFVALSRVAVNRLSIPLVVAAPVVWVGLELLRAHLLTGFSWYYLGHTQYTWIELIQISDLVGAYGVSFVVAMGSAAMAGLIPDSILQNLKLVSPQPDDQPQTVSIHTKIWPVVASTLVFACALGYGYVRRGQADFQPGPRVALIQGNFTSSAKHDVDSAQRIFEVHHYLTGQAVQYQPDIIVWPETMYRSPLLLADQEMSSNDLIRLAPRVPPEAWQNTAVQDVLRDLCDQTGAALVMGIETGVVDETGFRLYNSAAYLRPDEGLVDRYDKRHRVLFGEYIPLKDYLPWLHRLTPYSGNFGIEAGSQFASFQYRDWSISPVICFEDTVPHLVREAVKAPGSDGQSTSTHDLLVNLTNDGWFHGSSELDQHLITAAFRSVECRTPMVRAVNTGISAFIDGDGLIRKPDVFIDGDEQDRTSNRDPETGRLYKQINCALVSTIPIDNRESWYVATGDWFAASCGAFCLFLLFSPLVPNRKANLEQTQLKRTSSHRRDC